MDARAIIAKTRKGQTPSKEELGWFAQGLADQTVTDAQAAAFAMAVCLNGLGEEGRVALTCAMRDSGDVLSWDLDAPVLDKHSTGGVGDCVSLVLAPALAACGAYVPMISGRGLGHTGGTLDKLEAIPGFATQVDHARLTSILNSAGCAIVGASARIAPADKRLYAIRDVTATVESLDLITASILSKKLAAGLEGLVLDVKLGSGAFMKSVEEAQALARALVSTANAAGCPTRALITDMNTPVANALGNALEVETVVHVLRGDEGGRLLDLSAALGGEVLFGAGLAESPEAGADAMRLAVRSGRAAEQFSKMVYAQGGPHEFLDNASRFLPEAPVILEVPAPEDGFIATMDGEALGLAVVDLGGGRRVESDRIDPAVGLSDVLGVGDPVAKGQPLARIHAARTEQAAEALKAVLAAITIGDRPAEQRLVVERITA